MYIIIILRGGGLNPGYATAFTAYLYHSIGAFDCGRVENHIRCTSCKLTYI